MKCVAISVNKDDIECAERWRAWGNKNGIRICEEPLVCKIHVHFAAKIFFSFRLFMIIVKLV